MHINEAFAIAADVWFPAKSWLRSPLSDWTPSPTPPRPYADRRQRHQGWSASEIRQRADQRRCASSPRAAARPTPPESASRQAAESRGPAAPTS